jgi:hypothetical protein
VRYWTIRVSVSIVLMRVIARNNPMANVHPPG